MSVLPSLRFRQPDLETRFRAEGSSRDVRLVGRLLLLAVAFQAMSAPADLALLDGPRATVVLGLRLGGIGMSLLSFWAVRRAPGFQRVDQVTTVWMAFIMADLLMASALLPADYAGQLPWHVLLVLGAYCVPVPLSSKASLALLLSLGNVLLFLLFKELSGPARIDLVSAFACANLIGLFAAREGEGWSRKQFLARLRELEAKRELRDLRHIVPVCASCKQVRRDEGYWELVEDFLANHPEARSSRGICPNCVRALYPALAQ